jgi:hypothetical protein
MQMHSSGRILLMNSGNRLLRSAPSQRFFATKELQVLVRLVPLTKGGIPANEEWIMEDKPGRLVVTDESATAMQLTQQLVAEFAELKHLSPLTVEQLSNFVSLHHNQSYSLLWDSFQANPQSLRTEIKVNTERGLPTLNLVYPLTIEERLLQTVPRDDSKPLLWLDVDGVVNGSMGSDKVKIVRCFSDSYCAYGVSYSPQIVRELNRLARVCDLHWATMWGKAARFRLAPVLGFDDFNVWKGGKGNLDNVVNFDRPLIWIDDHLDPRSWDGAYVRNQAPKVKAAFKNHLLIGPRLDEERPEKGFGLTMRHIAQIDAFLAAQK